ncbi:hypothetical protein QQ045_028554 [Rhodiola kirilowii]
MSRRSKVLPRCISEEQVGFIKGRRIHENIALAHDIIHDLNHKTHGGNILIKLDMAKAYDKVSWSFLLRMFRSLGFAETWCDRIFRCISNCFYSIKWDGSLYGFFKSTRGVCQGDPLSPGLFVLTMEWFIRQINEEVSKGQIKPYVPKKRGLMVVIFCSQTICLSLAMVPSLL